MCPPGTCATLGTIRGGTASAVGSSEARRFWRALPASDMGQVGVFPMLQMRREKCVGG